MNLELFNTLSKYPFIFNGEFKDSVELKQNKTCMDKCKEMDCILFFQNEKNDKDYICSKGYDNLLLKISDLEIILNGLIYTSNKVIPQGRKEARKDWIVSKDSVLLFIKNIQEIEDHIVKCTNETIEKNFSMFHDVKTSMSILFNCTQDIINKLPGDTLILPFLRQLTYKVKLDFFSGQLAGKEI